MTEHLWVVDRGYSPVYRRLLHYRRRSQLSLQEAVELASVARRVGGPVIAIHRGRRCDASDPFALFLLKITSGDALAIEAVGPMTREILEELEQIAVRMATALDNNSPCDLESATVVEIPTVSIRP